MPNLADVLERRGLRVKGEDSPSWRVIVEQGSVILADQSSICVEEEQSLAVNPPGRRSFVNQTYAIVGEASQSPCFWNTEDIRGSGGAPYQRMVPGSLRVYNADRSKLYRPDCDYSYDYYWGTVKRHPHGAIAENEILSLDYEVWLCRYDTVVLQADGRVMIAEGQTEAPESRELLLPDPPQIKEGIALAYVFTGWGEEALYNGEIRVLEENSLYPHLQLPQVYGRYMDATPREYYVEVLSATKADRLEVRIAAMGRDYGLEQVLTEENMRWLEAQAVVKDERVKLLLKSAYGYSVDWGLSLDFTAIPLERLRVGTTYRITATPHSIYPIDFPATNSLDLIPFENTRFLEGFREKLFSGMPVRVAFYGESTSRTGRWPYLFVRSLREMYPDTVIHTSNVAIGGENSSKGAWRYEREVRSVKPDLVAVEYMLNDAWDSAEQREAGMRRILGSLREDGIPCLLLTNNGMNPAFGRSFDEVGEVHQLYRRLAREYGCAFIGGYEYFRQLHRCGIYFLTELKGNMINHPYGNVDPEWGSFDCVLARAVYAAITQTSLDDHAI